MLSVSWIEKRRRHWEELDRLTERAQRGLHGLGHSELRELGLLYRQTAADLAVAHEDESGAHIAAYLNRLLGKSHNIVYMGHRPRAFSRILSFYRDEYPRLFREMLPGTLVAVAIFFFTMIAGWAVTIYNPAFAHRMLGEQMMDTIAKREMWTHSVLTIQPLAASGIMTNNLTVSFTTFALGITVVGTIWMMLLNGLLMGVIGAATWHAGMAISLWSFVAPHGVLELPAIFIAGGAGFEISRGLLFPGLLPRRESLARAGSRASRLLLATIPLLLIAGTIEGFFSPGPAPVTAKFTLAAILGSALAVYLFRSDSGPSLRDTD
ncbi:MAG TPA: stage II sporulation protein M [Bryobacteraceae bacterium]|nr:stage II sporulation protein M [Bryobacteraceae bacterium]